MYPSIIVTPIVVTIMMVTNKYTFAYHFFENKGINLVHLPQEYLLAVYSTLLLF